MRNCKNDACRCCVDRPASLAIPREILPDNETRQSTPRKPRRLAAAAARRHRDGSRSSSMSTARCSTSPRVRMRCSSMPRCARCCALYAIVSVAHLLRSAADPCAMSMHCSDLGDWCSRRTARRGSCARWTGNFSRPPRTHRLQSARTRAAELAAAIPGVLVEDKGAAIALHYRAVPQAEVGRAPRSGRDARTRRPDRLRFMHGEVCDRAQARARGQGHARSPR